MEGTIIQQGSFTSDGRAKILAVRSDIDWMETINFTQMSLEPTVMTTVKSFWRRGMAPRSSIAYSKENNENTLSGMTFSEGGFTLLDTSDQTPGPLNSNITAISNASTPVVTNSGINGLSSGDIVRISNVTGAQQLGGIDFTVGNNTLSDTTFSLDFMVQIAAGTTGSWRKIPFHPQFYPRRRTITAITQATRAVITMSVTHGFTAGQAVRLKVPSAYGMQEMDSLIGNITDVNTTNNTITVDIDSSAFTTFSFPLTAAVPFTFAEVIPVGETANVPFANNLDDATNNVSIIGMELGAGIDSPAGSNNDLIYWCAGKSFSVTNE